MTKTWRRVLSTMAQGVKIWEDCAQATFTLIVGREVMRVNPRTMYAMKNKGLIRQEGMMSPVFCRQSWTITRLGEIEIFNRER
jgi:hypothetical protein